MFQDSIECTIVYIARYESCGESFVTPVYPGKVHIDTHMHTISLIDHSSSTPTMVLDDAQHALTYRHGHDAQKEYRDAHIVAGVVGGGVAAHAAPHLRRHLLQNCDSHSTLHHCH